MRWSIRYQLLLPLFLLLLGIVGITTWSAVTAADQARQQIEEDVRNVGHTLSSAGFSLNWRVLGHMKNITGADFLVVDDPRELLPSDNPKPPTTLPPTAWHELDLPPAEVAVNHWDKLRLGPPVTIAGQTFLCSGVRLRRQDGNQQINAGTLYVLYPEPRWRTALWQAIRPSVVLGVAAGLASLVLAFAVSQRLGRRIQELERRTRLIAAGDFSPMPLPRRNDELRDLSRSVNDMAQQLAQLQETVRETERLRLLGQLGSGLAHQLRNGVTGARLAVQLHASECNGHADAESLVVALRQLDLVEANLKRFLALGRPDDPRRDPCSLTALIEEATALLRPQCRHAGIALRWQPPQTDVVVRGDADRLGHLVLNLLTNAVEAAGPNGWVEIKMENAIPSEQSGRRAPEENPRTWCRIEVADSGPGPGPAVAARLFQPFITGKREGIGLGLMVARQVAEVHGGSIDWRRETDRTCFRVELPV